MAHKGILEGVFGIVGWRVRSISTTLILNLNRIKKLLDTVVYRLFVSCESEPEYDCFVM
jgi:hypothetical protein